MKVKKETIELRSEKVRELIGQIPPLIIRIGITVNFAVIILIIFLTYKFKYPEIIQGEINLKNVNSRITGYLKLPVKKINKIRDNPNLLIKLNCLDQNGDTEFRCKIIKILPAIEISNENATQIAYLYFPDPLITRNGSKIKFSELEYFKVDIITGYPSLLEKLIEPVKFLFDTGH